MRLPFLLAASMVGPLLAQSPDAITAQERLSWAARNAVGPQTLAGGLFSAGFGTLINKPREYGPHWEGFGKRYAMRLTGTATSSAMEAGLGAVWGEDPRYHRASGQPLKGRVGNIFKSAFLAHDRDGNWMPAYARYAAVPGSNFLSNTWRADGEARARDALVRTGLGFSSRIVANAFNEFWPELKKYVFRMGE